MSHKSWDKICLDHKIAEHDFEKSPFELTAAQIKIACQEFKTTGEKEVRILCKHDCREDRPNIFVKNSLFILPTKNGKYALIKGEGYIDIPEIREVAAVYKSKLEFPLETSRTGNSEMQHLDYAYAASLVRTFMQDDSLVLTIRGRKFSPKFHFFVKGHRIDVEGVQTEVDAGYEGKDQVVLIEAKNSATKNTIIRQLYYPYRQWQTVTKKKVKPLFFERNSKDGTFALWQFEFKNMLDYNSVNLVRAGRFRIVD